MAYFFTVRSIVCIDGFSTIGMISSAIESVVFAVSPKTVIFEDIKHRCELGEEKYSISIFFAPEIRYEPRRCYIILLFKQLVQNDHFATVVNNMLFCCVRRARLSTVKKIWVIGTFSQMHQNVHKAHFPTALIAASVKNVDILEENLFVPLLLHLRHGNVDVNHFLRKKGLFYVSLF